MGAAPAEDSHSRIAQVAASIRALLSIVNRYTELIARAARQGNSSFYVTPQLPGADPGGMRNRDHCLSAASAVTS
jgi:hypothetical protein